MVDAAKDISYNEAERKGNIFRWKGLPVKGESRGKMELRQFYEGNEWNAHEYFGAHVKDEGVVFRVYAPRAKRVAVIGEFNCWSDTVLSCEGRGGIHQICIPEAKEGQMYKYRIYHHDGSVTDKADPYGFGMELRPCSASIIRNLHSYSFTDEEFMMNRDKGYNRPMHIYEIHFGSWRANGDKWYRYEELGEVLIPYLKEMGYTHVELLPLNEHPADESWGYQSTGFFAPTSRYGDCDGLKEFVNRCHRAGIGVILDFVLVHFAVDDYGLALFDGAPLYEQPFSDVTESEWGSYNFIHARGEVQSFLKSCANYWLTEYHIDGLRFDAISNIIYWRGRQECGVNEKALQFVQSLNEGLHRRHPGALLIAEDSTSFLKVTAPVAYGGLGFDYKWDLGFMHDTLSFFACPPEERRNRYQDILFSMHYFYNELYMLAFSHDEVVHGKKTILDKLYGGYEEKFAQCRELFLYMLTHPGKKLNFMGNEIGQFREWAYYRPQDFDVLKPYPMHCKFRRFFQDINQIYLTHPALYEGEYNRDCFSCVIGDKAWDLVYAYERKAGGERILVVLNLGDVQYQNYLVRLSGNHLLRELLNTERDIYGGELSGGLQELPVRNGQCIMDLAPYSGRLFQVV
ncbi:MAG: 1,4-alpha-glucan branching protein GlgB [Bacteroidales bacterium]|nr:1,4-alpha-glucan branching protein GlgB [Bacteroidales bacterium]